MMPYCDESLDSRWYREHSIALHKKQLQRIKDRSALLSNSPKRYSSVNKRKFSCDKDNGRLKETHRENMILYEKLTQISERKWSPKTIKGPKSLNITLRKKDAERIMQENLEFVKRLTEKQAFVSAKKFKEEYEVLEGYKRTISKAQLHERLSHIKFPEIKPLVLPPIDQESLKSNEKRFNLGYESKSKNSPSIASPKIKLNGLKETKKVEERRQDRKSSEKIEKIEKNKGIEESGVNIKIKYEEEKEKDKEKEKDCKKIEDKDGESEGEGKAELENEIYDAQKIEITSDLQKEEEKTIEAHNEEDLVDKDEVKEYDSPAEDIFEG